MADELTDEQDAVEATARDAARRVLAEQGIEVSDTVMAAALDAASCVYDEAQEADAQRMLNETMFAGMGPAADGKGWQVRLKLAYDLATKCANAMRTILDSAGADNYVEQTFTDQETYEKFVFIVCRPGRRTPHELRRAAEAERDTAARRGTDLTIALSNTVHDLNLLLNIAAHQDLLPAAVLAAKRELLADAHRVLLDG